MKQGSSFKLEAEPSDCMFPNQKGAWILIPVLLLASCVIFDGYFVLLELPFLLHSSSSGGE